MEKKIIGFKLIKKYPLSGEINYICENPSESTITEYSKWPEFWEPIYEEIGVDLQDMYHKRMGGYIGLTFTQREHILGLMKQACKQTLELVVRKVLEEEKAGYKIIKRDIMNLLNEIK